MPAVLSAGGSTIAFVSDRAGSVDVWTMAEDGSAQTQRTTNPAYDERPCWSPDGQRILFVSRRLESFEELYVLDADGVEKNVGRVQNTKGGREPDWSAR